MPENLYRRGNIWWGRAKVAGVEHRCSLRTGSKSEALKRRKAWLDELQGARFYGEARRSWKEAVTRYVAEVMPGSVKPSTAARYLTSLRQIRHILDDLYIDQIGNREMAQIAGRAGISNATRRRDLTAVSSVLTAAIAWGWCETNAAGSFNRRIIRERRDPIQPPSDADIAAVVMAAPQMMGRLILLLYQTGMRLHEAGWLEHSEIHMQGSEILLTRTKTGRPRRIALSDAARGTLGGTARALNCPWVFWHDAPVPGVPGARQPARYNNLPTNLAKLVDRTLNPLWHRQLQPGETRPPKRKTFRIHDLRHRFAIDELLRGRDIYSLQQHLGHSSVKTTEVYLAYLGSAQKGAQMQRFDAGWPYAKPLKDMSYDELLQGSQQAAQAVL